MNFVAFSKLQYDTKHHWLLIDYTQKSKLVIWLVEKAIHDS